MLMELANHLQGKGLKAEAKTLRRIVAHMWRRPHVRKTDPKSVPMTAARRARIRDFGLAHPDLSEQEIGVIFNVNSGRVSEALAGFRR